MQKIIQQYQDYSPDAATQARLNQPLKKEEGLHETHQSFLALLIKKLEDGSLNPLSIPTLFNPMVYEKLDEEEREKTDLTALNLMSVIRQIETLWKLEHRETFQMESLAETVFQMKSAFEAKHGDVFVI